ncbi:MAG: hypothetical protein JW827_02100 [Spirochaetes bacterium]|nr:hypothetical protein [Spirochaetota bacterium]
MIVPVSILLQIDDIDSYYITFNRKDPHIAAIYNIAEGRIEKSIMVTQDYLNQLHGRGVTRVSINSNRKIQDAIKAKAPHLFEQPTGMRGVGELFMWSNEYEIMNMKSNKKRYVKILDDIFSNEINIVSGEKEMMIEYGTLLSSKILSRVKKTVDPTQQVFYKDSEEGVLVFVPDVKNFKMKVDLFAILSTFDFAIYDANNSREAVNIYKQKFPKLVILGNLGGSIESKMVFLEIEEYDPFVKKLNYDESPATNRKFETERIRTSYYSGYTKFLDIEKKSKESLPEEIKNTVFESIQKLQKSWSLEQYTETAYAVKQFGRVFNVSSLWHILQNVKRRYT